MKEGWWLRFAVLHDGGKPGSLTAGFQPPQSLALSIPGPVAFPSNTMDQTKKQSPRPKTSRKVLFEATLCVVRNL